MRKRLVTRWTRSSPYLTLQKRRGDFWRTVLRTASAPIMPPSRKCRSSRTNPPVTLQEGRLGQRKRNHCDEQWNARFKELLDYRSEHGNCDIPTRQGKLGTWVNGQRRAYRKKTLAQDRIDRLNRIGFRWTSHEVHKEAWENQFDELVKYKAKHGDCDIPTRQGKLGTWVNGQRRAYRKKTLAQDRIDRLNSIGFKWKKEQSNVPWKTQFDELVKYKAKHGDCNVPVGQGKLGRWVHKQRTHYKNNNLSKERIHQLNGIGFNWTSSSGCSRKKKAFPSTSEQTSSRQMPWEIRFDKLVKYKAKHGHCDVPQREGPLGRWAHQQRESYKKNKLSQDRIVRLNGIVFDWTPPIGRSRKRESPKRSRLSQDSLSRPMRVSSLSTEVESHSTGARAMGVDPDEVKGQRFDSEPSLPLQIPSSKSNHNLGTESDDEVDEIGALIYDQVMQRKQVSMRRRTRSSKFF